MKKNYKKIYKKELHKMNLLQDLKNGTFKF